MITLSHPNAPTVQYKCAPHEAIAAYVLNHLNEFTVDLVEDDSALYGVAFRVADKATGERLQDALMTEGDYVLGRNFGC